MIKNVIRNGMDIGENIGYCKAIVTSHINDELIRIDCYDDDNEYLMEEVLTLHELEARYKEFDGINHKIDFAILSDYANNKYMPILEDIENTMDDDECTNAIDDFVLAIRYDYELVGYEYDYLIFELERIAYNRNLDYDF